MTATSEPAPDWGPAMVRTLRDALEAEADRLINAGEMIHKLYIAAIGRFLIADAALLALIAHHPDRWYVVLPLGLLASWIATQAIVESHAARKFRRQLAEHGKTVDRLKRAPR